MGVVKLDISFFYIFFMYIYYYITPTPLALDPAGMIPSCRRTPRTGGGPMPQVVRSQGVSGGRPGLNTPGDSPEIGQRPGRDPGDFGQVTFTFSSDVEL